MEFRRNSFTYANALTKLHYLRLINLFSILFLHLLAFLLADDQAGTAVLFTPPPFLLETLKTENL